ncbi:RDD family protein [Acidothermaceae bacterium B102]|nr:RDD family protein [Acidothermaceae bacterium B102]
MTYGYAPPPGAVTGEAVSLELRPARLGSRTVALLIDLVVQFVLYILLSIVAGKVADSIDTDLASTLGLVVVLLIVFGYPVILETIWRGRTLGKAAMGLRVVRDDGGPASFSAILIRELVGYVLEKPGITLGILGIITMTSSERAKRLGDMFAGTIVISTRVPGSEPAPVTMPPPLAGWASTVDLSRVPDSLGLAVRQFLARAAQLDPAARERVGGQLVAELSRFVTPPPPPGTPGWAFLTAILAERRRRDEVARHRHAAPTYSMAPPVYGAPAPVYGSPAPQQLPPPPPPPGPGGFSAPV